MNIRNTVWLNSFNRLPVELQPTWRENIDECPAWIIRQAHVFIFRAFGFFAAGQEDNELLADLISIIYILAPHGTLLEQETVRESVITGVDALVGSALLPDNVADPALRECQDNIVRTIRSLLHRTEGQPQSLTRLSVFLPRWVQEVLVERISASIWDELFAGSEGSAPRAKPLVIMVAANFPAIRSILQKNTIFELMKQLRSRLSAYDDPFLSDRVFIIERTVRQIWESEITPVEN